MRLIGAIKADIRFQYKQGVYGIYIFLIILYSILISIIPKDVRSIAVPLIVLTDPTIVGFFFMGGVIMLEKAQGVLEYLTITPLKPSEYILSKVISFAIIGEIAGFLISFISYQGKINFILMFITILLSSIFFSLIGFLPSLRSITINQYFLLMIPYLVLLLIHCIIIFIFVVTNFLIIIPSVTAMNIMIHAFKQDNMIGFMQYIGILYIALFDIVLYKFVFNRFIKNTMF